MKRINYHLTENQIEALKKIKRETGLSLAEIVRRALDNFLENIDKKKINE